MTTTALKSENPAVRDKYYLPLLMLVCTDFFILSGSFIFSYYLRFYTPIREWYPPNEGMFIPDYRYYFFLAPLIGLFSLFVFERAGLYEKRVGLDRQVWPGLLIIATIISYIFVMAALFNYRGFWYNRFAVALAIPVSAAGVIAAHYILKKTQFFMLRRGIGFHQTILIGTERRCQKLLEQLQEIYGSQYQVTGYINSGERRVNFANLPCLGNLEQLKSLLEAQPISHVIIAMQPEDADRIFQVMNICHEQHVQYKLIPELFDSLCKRVNVDETPALPALLLGESTLDGFGFAIKRFMDCCISLSALIITAPIMILIAVLIKLDSRGPVFFVQERVGCDGQKFNIYKFRSMVDDAEKNTGPKWATTNDPRTTRLGRFLRKYNLDELPQFVNVLRGEMSLVGPRPERPYFVNKFKEEITLYMRRHMVKAGMTGLAQINGWRGDTSVKMRTRYDLYYVKNWSLLMDVKIILKTLTSFKNAY
jgi:exopolysaccharide biosynthesis polyprenyl glycosylphosphotransferase